jgi:hypothetical protein
MVDRGVQDGCVGADDWIFQGLVNAQAMLNIQRGDVRCLEMRRISMTIHL